MSSVLYQPYDGSDGLQSQGSELLAWKEGQNVGSAPLPQDEDMQMLLWNFRAVDLLPDIDFTLVPEKITADLELDLVRIYEGTLLGSGALQGGLFDGSEFQWRAEYGQEDTFMEEGPRHMRPWAGEEELGFGWRIYLPEKLYEDSDFAFRQRIGLSIEAFLYALASHREIPIPYLRRIDNVFSSKKPVWRTGPPRILYF